MSIASSSHVTTNSDHYQKIRKYLTENAAKKLSHAFISSRLDNLNSLLFNLPNNQIKKLQLIQNNAARVVVQQNRSCHITPILIDLHWLPVVFRIHYKILLLVYKCINGKGPAYLTSLLQTYTPPRALRSSTQLLLTEVPSQKKYGERAFCAAGPKLWNYLPLHIRQCNSVAAFKSSLKTYLFKTGYDL